MELIESIPLIGGFLSVIIPFVAALSVIVAIHEYGHYIVGRWCGIHAEVFSLGFGPVLLSGHDRRGTRWQLAAIPFGGYVKFLGDADASSKADEAAMAAMDAETRSRSFHGAALYKKALTVAAGPLSNFILSTVVFMGLAMAYGLATDRPTIGEMKPLPGSAPDIAAGDVILAVNGTDTPGYLELFDYARAADPSVLQVYTIERDGDRLERAGPFPLLPVIESLTPRSAAIEAGLKQGDLITAIDDQPIIAFRQLQEAVKASAGRELVLTVIRDGATLTIPVTPRVVDHPSPDGGFEQRVLIGIEGGLFFDPLTVVPGPIDALSIGVSRTAGIITGSISGLWNMVQGAISVCNLQGPVGIAKTTGDMASQGFGSFINLIAVLSTAIGLLNLFPVPVLDGGHLVFFAWEAVTGRPPQERVLNVLMTIGLFLIIALMVFAFGNDFLC
jgi:regulator of sigma E protease